MKLFLASTSPRRQELIQRLGLPIEILKNTVDETFDPGWRPEVVVQHLSKIKAKAAYNSLKESLQAENGVLVGADTIVVVNNTILGKPENKSHAVAMLQTLQGNQHKVLTGITLIETATGREVTVFEETLVWMKALDMDQIENYIATGEPMDKAGAEDTTMYLGDNCQYRIVSRHPSGKPKMIVGHSVSKVTFKPMSDEEISAYVNTGEPLDKAGAYGVQGIGAFFVEKIEGDFYSVMGLPLNLLYQMLKEFGINPLTDGNL